MKPISHQINSRIQRSVCIITFMLSAIVPALGQMVQDYSNTTVKNATGEPLSILNINDNGKRIAKLYITGKEAQFDANQRVVRGAGFIQANNGETVTILVTIKESKPIDPNYNQLAINVNRIDWDEDGKTIAISGVAPYINTARDEKWKIISDLDKPPLENGVLTLELEQKGKALFDIRFGDRGTLVGNADFLFGDTRFGDTPKIEKDPAVAIDTPARTQSPAVARTSYLSISFAATAVIVVCIVGAWLWHKSKSRIG